MRKRQLQLAIVLVPLLFLTACGGNSLAGWGPGSTEGNASTQHIVAQGGLIIFASPNLQQVLPVLATAFLKARKLTIPYAFNFSNAVVNANTANTLADADLLISDSQRTMTDARNLGFTRSFGVPLAADTLTVLLPPANPGKIRSLQDLARSGLRYLGILAESGLGQHIQATLERMMLAPPFGAHYPARVYGNLIINYTDGSAAAQAVSASPPAGDFAIVYHTDYLAIQQQQGTRALLTLPIPAQFNPPAETLAAVTSQASNPGLAQQFIDFIRSPQAQLTWKQFGFQPAA